MSIFVEIGGLILKSASGVVLALVLAPLGLWIARRARLIDMPLRSAHKLHRLPTPLAGGIILTLSMAVLVPLFHLWQGPISTVLILAVVIFLFGLLDDAKGLSAPKKFIGQFIASILLGAFSLSVHFLRNTDIPVLSREMVKILDWVVTIFWFVGITNAFNLIDGMDGLAVGVAGIAFATFMLMSYMAQQSLLADFCALCLGICIALYHLNKSPARLFLGDAGALSLGFLLAAVGMIYTPAKEVPQGSSWFIPILVLGFPVFDTTLVVISRLRRKANIFQADRTHTFHRLVALGLEPDKARTIIHLAALSLGLLTFFALSLPPWSANLVFGLVVFAGLMVLIGLERARWQMHPHGTHSIEPMRFTEGGATSSTPTAATRRGKKNSSIPELEQKSGLPSHSGLD